jgi:hypothetical protein
VNETSSTAVIKERRMKNAERRKERGSKSGHHDIGRNFSLAVRHSSFVIILLLVGLQFPVISFAESANRWLLIFDTSSSMRSRAKGVQDSMQDLLSTGMHGQIRPGDTIGIWTFSDKLHAGEVPLQVWSQQEAQTIYRHTLQYLANLRYTKSARLPEVLTNVFSVVDSSDFITIILFSDGSEPINGTPFDNRINALYKDNYRQQKKTDMPVITVLQAKHGNFTTNTVNFQPWPVEIPSVPAPPPPKAAPQAPAPKPPAAPPIIYDGRKDQSAAPSTPQPVAESTPAPVVSANQSSEPTPAVTPQATATTTATEPPAATAQPTTTTAHQPATSIESPPAATAPPATATAENKPEPKPTASPVTAQPPNESSTPPASSETANASSPVDTATSTPQSNLLSARNIAIVSVAFTVIVVGLLLMSARQSRKSQASLITRSLDREGH